MQENHGSARNWDGHLFQSRIDDDIPSNKVITCWAATVQKLIVWSEEELRYGRKRNEAERSSEEMVNERQRKKLTSVFLSHS